MKTETSIEVLLETTEIASEFLQRDVTVNFYLPTNIAHPEELSLLLINDGQDLVAMGFDKMISYLLHSGKVSPLLCVGIHCGEDRKNEYGMLSGPDFKGRGSKAAAYKRFIFEELLPYVNGHYKLSSFRERAFAGFSLGALSAFDMVWNHPETFSKAGVFSGSLWWRSKDKSEKDYHEAKDRMLHRMVHQGEY